MGLTALLAVATAAVSSLSSMPYRPVTRHGRCNICTFEKILVMTATKCVCAAVTVGASDVALLNLGHDRSDGMRAGKHPRDTMSFLPSHMVKLEHNGIVFTAVNARMVREIFVDHAGIAVPISLPFRSQDGASLAHTALPDCATPLRPGTVPRRKRQLRKRFLLPTGGQPSSRPWGRCDGGERGRSTRAGSTP